MFYVLGAFLPSVPGRARDADLQILGGTMGVAGLVRVPRRVGDGFGHHGGRGWREEAAGGGGSRGLEFPTLG